MTGNFKERLESRVLAGSFLCVGLDPTLEDRRKLHNPNAVGDVVEHLSSIVRATAPYAAAFKPNRAFYDGMGRMGDEVLRRVVDHIRFYHPDIPVILDNKLGDIATTNNGYVAMADLLGVEPHTLRFGTAPRSRVAEPRMTWPAGVGSRERQTIDAYLQLPPKKRELVGELVKALSDSA